MTGEQFNAIRKKCRLKYGEYAQVLGCNPRTVRAYCIGARTVPEAMRRRATALLTITPDLEALRAQLDSVSPL